jgi:hypothetical protein
MGYPPRGRADYWEPADWNIVCSMCGRKRKASETERNWQGLYRCPEHNEPRQPQDFVRNVKDIMTVPFDQEETSLFVETPLTFPLSISPSSIVLSLVPSVLTTETGNESLVTESGDVLTTEVNYAGTVGAVVPSWVIPTSFQWSWLSGGAEIVIGDPTSVLTTLQTLSALAQGVLQVVVTSSLGGTATATVNVSA